MVAALSGGIPTGDTRAAKLPQLKMSYDLLQQLLWASRRLKFCGDGATDGVTGARDVILRQTQGLPGRGCAGLCGGCTRLCRIASTHKRGCRPRSPSHIYGHCRGWKKDTNSHATLHHGLVQSSGSQWKENTENTQNKNKQSKINRRWRDGAAWRIERANKRWIKMNGNVGLNRLLHDLRL